MKAKVSFSKTNPAFTSTLKRRVDEYFTSNHIEQKGNWKLYSKTIILFSIAVATYYLLVFVSLPVWASLLLCVLMGFNFSAIGFNVMHDGAHGSYSRKHWVNELMGYSLNLMGGCSYLWKQKHNMNHHSFTNVEGFDDDIDVLPFMRTNTNQPRKWFHRFQHIYWTLLYCFTYISWIFNKDFTKYFSGKIAQTEMRKMELKEHVIFWVSKAVYFFVFLVIPIWRLGWVETLIGYLVMTFVCGWILAVIFQLAHIVGEAAFPLPDTGTKKMEQEWTIHQLHTTANFGTRNKVLSWFAGGLNFQIEHHLFPKISHIHYPEVSKLVQDVCRQFNVPYIEYPSFFSALRSHVSYLKTVGVNKN